MAGVAFTFAAEFLDKGIRRSSDIFSIVDSQIVVSIPYITTASEIRRSRRRIVLTIVFLLLASVGALVAAYYFLPPLDEIIAKARVGLFR